MHTPTNRSNHDISCLARRLREAMGPGYHIATFRDQRFLTGGSGEHRSRRG